MNQIPRSARREALFCKIVDCVSKNEQTGCWEWSGGHSGKGRGGGYGRVYYQGQTIAAHRAMYILVHGYVHKWQHIDHTCRNRCCVNPDHLEAVSPAENQQRRAEAAKLVDLSEVRA